jgi:hypothetical protein
MSNSDKLNKLAANIINFASGERLTSDKLNELVSLLEININNMSAAIGDIYDENYDEDKYNSWGKQFTENTDVVGAKKRRLDIANIARLIGPASNLNPRSASYGNEESTIVELIPGDVSSYTLKYPLKSGGVPMIPGYTKVANVYSLTGLATFYFLEDTNTLYFSSPLSETKDVTYITRPTEYAGGPNYLGARFNVLPDPNQVEGIVVTLNTDNSGNVSYSLTMPLVINQQSDHAGLMTILGDGDFNKNKVLSLPEWYIRLSDGEAIPEYLLYLKNYDTYESYTDAVYTKVSDTEILVTGINLGGDQDCVDGYDFRLITVGTDITTSIDDLRNKTFLHKHDGSFGEPRIDIKNIVGFYEKAAPSGAYYPSSTEWNPISNLLHRDGWVKDSDTVNGDNAMRGPLMMALQSFDPLANRVVTGSGTSEAIYFGEENKKISSTGSYLSIMAESTELNTGRGIFISSYGDTAPEDALRLQSSKNILLTAMNRLNSNNCGAYYTRTADPFVADVNADNSYYKNIIENTQSFKKTALEDHHLLFEIELDDLEDLIHTGLNINFTTHSLYHMTTIDNNGVATPDGGEWELKALAPDDLPNQLFIDINYFKRIDSTKLKDLFEYKINNTLSTIDYMGYSIAHDKVLISLSSKKPNGNYRLDLRGKNFVKDVGGTDYTYYISPFVKIEGNSMPTNTTPVKTEDAYVVIDRFKNYVSAGENEHCIYECKYDLFIHLQPIYTQHETASLAIAFNYNGHVTNGLYQGAFSGYEASTDNTSVILVEDMRIVFSSNSGVIACIDPDGAHPYISCDVGSVFVDKIKLSVTERVNLMNKTAVLHVEALLPTSLPSNVNFGLPVVL